MSPHTFALAVVLASVALALWTALRFPEAGPTTVSAAVLVILSGAAAVRAIPGLTDATTHVAPAAAPLVVPFAIALPLLTYTFLSGLWVLRMIQRSLPGFPR